MKHLIIKHKPKFSKLIPRSILASHHRFTYRDETNKKIKHI